MRISDWSSDVCPSDLMGKPVLAEVADADETGFEYTVFAIPLETADTEQDKVIVQIGGDKARLLGQKGGLTIRDGDVLSCEYLWAIQLSNMDGIRFSTVDGTGEAVAWTDRKRCVGGKSVVVRVS